MPKIDPKALMLFYEVLRTRGITAAAQRLNLPKATVSRKVRELEHQLGAVLLKRGPRSVAPTDLGAEVFEHCRRIAAELDDVASLAGQAQTEPKGALRIALPQGFGSVVVARTVTKFTTLFPEVELTVEITNRPVDVSREPFDVAIHMGDVPNQGLPSIRVAEIGRGVYASPSYCRHRGVPAAVADLARHDCILLASQVQAGLWKPVLDAGRVPAARRVTVTDIGVARELTTAGLGFAILPNEICIDDVARGKLQRVLPDWRLPSTFAMATFPDRRHLPIRVRAFLDLLKEQFAPAGSA